MKHEDGCVCHIKCKSHRRVGHRRRREDKVREGRRSTNQKRDDGRAVSRDRRKRRTERRSQRTSERVETKKDPDTGRLGVESLGSAPSS